MTYNGRTNNPEILEIRTRTSRYLRECAKVYACAHASNPEGYQAANQLRLATDFLLEAQMIENWQREAYLL
jgi:hypothetical protein